MQIISGFGTQRSYQPPKRVHHSPVRASYSQKRPHQCSTKSRDDVDNDDVVLLPSTSTSDAVKRTKLQPTSSMSKEQAQLERAERKKQAALV